MVTEPDIQRVVPLPRSVTDSTDLSSWKTVFTRLEHDGWAVDSYGGVHPTILIGLTPDRWTFSLRSVTSGATFRMWNPSTPVGVHRSGAAFTRRGIPGTLIDPVKIRRTREARQKRLRNPSLAWKTPVTEAFWLDIPQTTPDWDAFVEPDPEFDLGVLLPGETETLVRHLNNLRLRTGSEN